MPPGRQAKRVVAEHDENSTTTRMTRAKAASLGIDEVLQSKALQTKKSTTNGNVQGGRKRAALGDLSNVTKVNDARKATGKTGLVSKAAQPSGIQKKATTTRAALSNVEANKKIEPKRSGSGSGAIGVAPKRNAPASTTAVKEDPPAEEEPVRKRAHNSSDKKSKVEKEANSTLPRPLIEPVEEFVYPEGVRDLDNEDFNDPLMVSEYAQEIFEYLRDVEVRELPNPAYMSLQDDLEWKTRGILVDWLIEVHTRFRLLPETLFLAVNIIDRFLSAKVVQLDRLQLVGITAMFIASKYEEVLSPHVINFKAVADDGFTEAEILSAERFMLSTLNYNLSYPNPMNFLRRISKADNYDIQCRTIGKYLMEISLLDHRFMSYRPSHVAAGAMYLARMMLDRGDWDETITFYSGYTEEEVEPVAALMVDYLARPVIHEAFFKKYASKKFMKASILTRSWARKNAHLYGIEDREMTLDEIS